ncbi:E3 ubiquitin-protein ligase Praja-2, partial [Leptosomus discolor]
VFFFPPQSHVAKGSEAGKPAWPKPAGGYRTVTGRRYGRRYAYIHFRPSFNSQDRDKHQQHEQQMNNKGCERVDLDVQEENFSCCSPLVQVSSGLLDEPLSENIGTGEPVCRSVACQTFEVNTSPFSLSFYILEGNQMSRDFINPYENSEDLAEHTSALNHRVCRECCEKAGAMPLMSCFSIDSDLAYPKDRAFKPSDEDQAIPKSEPSGANYETQQIKNTVDVGIRTPIAIASELNVNDGKTNQGNSPELVVRPKIRKQSTPKKLGREKLLPNGGEESGFWRRTEIAEVQHSYAECALRNSEEDMSSSMFSDSREHEGHTKNTEIDLRKNAATQEQILFSDDDSFWDDTENWSTQFFRFLKNENSSECSDGELSFFAKDEDPGRGEPEPEMLSSASGVEENRDFCFRGREQTLLEEGEIPQLRYQEEVENKTEEESDPVCDFVCSGFFLLHGNNLEDDSSVRQDLDVEWRLRDEFGDGLGLAQATAFVDPLVVTARALEERLQQAIQITLANWGSLEFNAEEAHPPATQETIDCLPEIVVTDDYDGQEQSCTICWSEYVKDEIITELPCHHFFHKSCIVLWLQKSGTCPVCRQVLAPELPEGAAATDSTLSD